MTSNNNQPETETPTFKKYQKVWVKAEIEEQSSIDADIWCVNTKDENEDNFPFYTSINEIRTTAQILQEHGASVTQNTAETPHFATETPHNAELTEPDRTRKFRKGDKVRIVERWGRPLQDQEDFEDWGFKLNEVYEVAEDEDCDNAVKLINGEHYWYFPFYFLDLVEPAPEPKYWLHESPKTYSIYYKGQFGRVITAMLMQKDLYTIEEAQEQCDKLNEKEQNNA